MDLNKQLFFFIEGLKGKIPGLDFIMVVGAEVIIYLVIALNLILAIIKNGAYKEAFILSVFSIPVAFILVLLAHFFIKEKRPFISLRFKPLISFYRNLSFPSTHTTAMTIIMLSNFYSVTDLGPLILILLLWVAFARIYTGVHYPVDILGGIATGVLSFILTLFIRSF